MNGYGYWCMTCAPIYAHIHLAAIANYVWQRTGDKQSRIYRKPDERQPIGTVYVSAQELLHYENGNFESVRTKMTKYHLESIVNRRFA